MKRSLRPAIAAFIAMCGMLAICIPAIAADVVTPPVPAVAPSVPAFDWRARFDALYRLDDTQSAKFIAASTTPSRQQFYDAIRGDRFSRHPAMLVLQWDGKAAKLWNEIWSGADLATVLTYAFEIENYQFEAPEPLLRLRVPDGDFIIRQGATEAQRLAALQGILRELTRRDIRFELQTLDREVIVARGRYSFSPVPDVDPPSTIHLYGNTADEPSGGGGGSFERFLQALGVQAGRRVIDEAEKPSPIEPLQWHYHRSAYLAHLPDGPARAARTDQLLATVARQTDLSLIRERRKVPVWVISEK